jgi:hypothetical protein
VTDETRPTESYPLPPTPVQPAGSTSPAQPGGVPGSSPFATAPASQSPFAAPAAPQAPVVAPPARRRSGSSMLVNVLLGFALVVAVGGVAFAAGRATAPASTGNGRFGANGANGGFGGNFGPNASGAPNRGFGGGFGGAISIQGKVTAVAADSITIQLPSGQSVTIPTSDQTTYHSQTSASASDVTSGSDVIVQVAGGGRFVTGGNGNGGNGQGNNGNGNGNGGPAASGAPNRGFGSASSVTIVPAGG